MPASNVTATQSAVEAGATPAPRDRRDQYAARAALGALFLGAAASVLYMSFTSGGYFPNATGFAAIVCAQALVLRTTLADRPFEGFGWALNIPLGALALYTGWELASSLWSTAPARALDAYDRSLLYLLAFTLFGSLSHSRERLRWLIAALATALAAVCLAGLLTRVLPHVWPTGSSFDSDRLAYPLTYWNGEGMLAAVALILLVHLACDTDGHWSLRLSASSLVPPVAAALLLTFSRGGAGVAVIGLVAYVLLARPRGLPGALLALAPTTYVALRAAYNADLLAQSNLLTPAALAQGRHVAWVTAVCLVVAGALRGALLPLDRWLGERARHGPRTAADRRRVAALAGGGVAIVVALALLLGAPRALNRQYHQFVRANTAPASNFRLRDRFSSIANNGRVGLWETGLHAYRVHKLAGYGAGSYQVEYTRFRVSHFQYVSDAHSLYVQSLAELGLVGLVLIVIFVLATLSGLAMRIRGPGRAAPAALFAAILAWAIHGLVDWDWQLPATTLWLFAAAGLALARPHGRSRLAGVPRNRSVIAVGWLLVAVAPLLISISYNRVANSASSLARNNCVATKREAFSSISLLAVRPQAYIAIGLCDLRQGFPTAAMAAMAKALSYERDGWQEQYWLAVARAAAGVDPRAAAARAHADNPFEPLTSALVRRLSSPDPQSWERAAPTLQSEALSSGLFSLSAP